LSENSVNELNKSQCLYSRINTVFLIYPCHPCKAVSYGSPQLQLILTLNAIYVSKMIAAMREFIGTNQMRAYLVMMTARLLELHRVLKPIGSFYLHGDPTASHYLKIILDTIFGPENFRNEFIWGPFKRAQRIQDATTQRDLGLGM